MISEKNYDISFNPSKVFMSDNPIRSKLYCRVFIDKIGEGTWEVVNENEYDVINDSIVFSEFPIGKFLSMQVSTTPAELMQSPTENTIIVSIKNEIKEVADVASSIITVSDNINDLRVVSDNITKVQTVSDNITNVNNVGNSITNVNNVGNSITKVNTVADSITKVNTVSDSITNVNLVGNNILDVNTVGNNITKVQIVSDDIVNVNVVANNITKVNTVSSTINKVIILADNIIDVDVVASNILDIQTIADNVVDIQNAEENANSALLSKNLAEKWASELEDVPVSDGKYSAYHWALKASDLVSNGIIDDTTPSSIKTYSSNKIEAIMNDLDLSNIDETVTLKHFTDTLLNKVNGIAENANNYSLPVATDTILGGVKAGANITIDSEGFISSSASATETAQGLVELATTAESRAGTDDLRAITALKLFNSLKGSNQNLSASGYQKLHGGLIIQWGTFNTSTASYVTVAFPISFPNACLGITGSINNESQFGSLSYGNKTVNGFSASNWYYNGATNARNATSNTYLAIGY